MESSNSPHAPKAESPTSSAQLMKKAFAHLMTDADEGM
jgi:hypothetical protein